jgi:hypothetical protein
VKTAAGASSWLADHLAEAGRGLARLFRQVWLWSAYWRLYPLWDVLRQVVPEIELPAEPEMRWNIRYRLHRRVIEIRDAQLVLRPYAKTEVAGLIAAAAKSSDLSPDRTAAVVEAATIVSSLQSRLCSSSPGHDATSQEHVAAAPRNDIRAEAAALILVCHAIRRSPIVRRIVGRPPSRITLLGWMTERVRGGTEPGSRA